MSDPKPSAGELVGRVRRKLKFNLFAERVWPYVFATAVGLIVFRLWTSSLGTKAPTLIDKALPVAISVAAVLAGFQTAVPAILLSLGQSRVVKKLNKSKHFTLIIAYLHEAVLVTLLFIATSVSIFVYYVLLDPDRPSGQLATKLVVVGLSCAFALCLLLSYRVVHLMLKILKSASRET